MSNYGILERVLQAAQATQRGRIVAQLEDGREIEVIVRPAGEQVEQHPMPEPQVKQVRGQEKRGAGVLGLLSDRLWKSHPVFYRDLERKYGDDFPLLRKLYRRSVERVPS